MSDDMTSVLPAGTESDKAWKLDILGVSAAYSDDYAELLGLANLLDQAIQEEFDIIYDEKKELKKELDESKDEASDLREDIERLEDRILELEEKLKCLSKATGSARTVKSKK